MLSSFYLFLIPLLAACIYIAFKFFVHKKEIEKMENNAFLENKDENNLEAAKEKIFNFFDGTKNTFFRTLIVFFHWVLHFIVLFLKFISDITDILYAKSRDFFLQSATKEKGAVSVFWHHLKEYKKEKEEEETKDK